MPRTRAVVAFILFAAAMSPARAQRSANWPVYGGSDDHTHYSTLDQISPANVKQLKVAWTYDTHDAFAGSEMQTNPVVMDGVLYGTSPKLRVFALDATTGKELWSFDPNYGAAPTSRIRHRGVVVTGDRVLFNYRNRLYALDRRTGKPIRSFGDTGWVDLRAGLGRPVEGLSVSASTPGVVFGDMLIMGSSVPEALPSAPGDIRAYDVHSGRLVWSFHTIPHPGEPGYETWPPDAWKIAGGVNAWSGVTLDSARAMVFVATGSASYDFYGGNRVGDNLYANSVIALDARTGKHIWHYQVIRHDLWDRDLPAAPVLVTVKHGGNSIPAVAQITKTGHVWVFDREHGTPLFPVADRAMPKAVLAGDTTASTQHFPLSPPPFTRQQLTRAELTTRTPAAHAAALKLFEQYGTQHPFDPPNLRGTIIFPGVDGGGEWGGPAFDPETGLLYVNANEMAWLLKLVPRSDKSLYAANCASCHGDNRAGSAMAPSLVDVGQRRTRDQIVQVIREGTGRMPAFGSALEGKAIADIANYLLTGHDSSANAGPDRFGVPYRNAYFDIFLDHEGYPAIKPPWGTLSAIDLNSGTIRWKIPFGEHPKLAAQGVHNTGTDNYGGAIVTQNGLLFIGATTYDNTFRAFDKKTGKLLWSAKLPFAGNATPSTYMVDGVQYVVIACGGGKNGAKSGGTYVAFALPNASRAAATTRAPRDSAIAALQRELPGWMEQGGVPGVSVAVLRHGKTEWMSGFGVADKASGRRVDEHTRFSAASLSKTVFTYAVLELVDQGKLDLDAPLSRYVKPEVADDPRVDRITARIALSHRTGFPNWRPRGGALKIFFTPGERFSYSGEGIVYLQHAVEAIEGKPLEQVMRELVFQPLGMTESSYLWAPATAAVAATGYNANRQAFPLSVTADTARANAAASLNTTAHDYARFLEAILSGRGLKPSTLRAMETPQVAVDPTCTNCLSHAPDSLSKQLFWGFGWGIEQTPSGRYLWHWGDNGVFMAYVVTHPADSSAVLLFDNSDTGLSIAPAVVQTVLGGEHPSFNWLDYATFDSPAMRFAHAISTRGATAALQEFDPQLRNGAISESAVNSAGYRLLRSNNAADAILVFQRNTELHPTSANVFDSLGEAYAVAGDTTRAIASYERSLALDPNRESAKASLAKLRTTPASAPSTRSPDLVVYRIAPSATDSSIHRFDEPNYVVFAPPVKASAPLLIFLPGTGGRPQNTSDFANVAARQGYRVIGLEYTDTPAVQQICPRERDPNCSEEVRRKRIYGDDDTSLIDDSREESIVNRLTKLLLVLAHDHPADGWEQYLASGQPNWSRIAVSGLSQGAGMAAYIAQHTRVARVVLFSSPWDNYGRLHTLAPWVRRGTGATPTDEWFAAYHEKEATAPLIAEAYSALGIPSSHIRVFTLEPAAARSANPYHPSGVADGATPRTADGSPAYLDDWRFLLGDVH